MFGLLPVYASRESIEIQDISEGDLARDTLALYDMLITINATSKFEQGEVEAISEYVRNGGSLLALCDHTDVFGQMEGTNKLLSQFGVALRFDSAYPAGQPWAHCLVLDEQIEARARPSKFNSGVGVGCSLDGIWPVQPLIVGKYAFSDTGDYSNVPGAYLGNYTLDQGEKLGNQLLAVWRIHGKGKVAVYGDTSFIQNSALPQTWGSNVLPLLRWLAAAPHWSEKPVPIMAPIVAAVLAGLMIICLGGSSSSMELGVIIGLLAMTCRSMVITPNHPAEHSSDEIMIDLGHMNRTGHWESRWNDIGPLYSAIQREGFLVREFVESKLENFGRPQALVIVDPARHYEEDEVAQLIDYANIGGRLILCLGPVGASSLSSLMNHLGITISTRCIGRTPPERAWGNSDDGSPQFREGYPILAAGIETLGESETRVLYTTGQDVLAISKQMGKGIAVIIGDPRFFSSANIEGAWGYHPGNIAFLYHAFEQLIGSRRDRVIEPFQGSRNHDE